MTRALSMLLVGDEPALLLGLLRGLRRAGHDDVELVTVAGVMRPDRRSIDVLIVDPDTDVPAAVVMIRQFQAQFPRSKVLVLSTSEQSPVSDVCLLPKPVRIGDLLAVL